MFFDSHTHLNDYSLFLEDERYINNFIKNSWVKMLNSWVNKDRIEKAIFLQEKYKDICLTSIGFHPSEAVFDRNLIDEKNKYLNDFKLFLKEKIKNHTIHAIWECWLDYHYEWSLQKKDLQKKLFKMQCDVAKEFKFPLVIHSRDAFDDTIEILKNYKELKIYFHCWWYWAWEIDIVQNLFEKVWIWFTGNITYKKAEGIRESFIRTKENNLLFETDAPYLTPQIIRKQKNQPANVRYIYEYAENIKKKDLKKNIEKNFNEFFWL